MRTMLTCNLLITVALQHPLIAEPSITDVAKPIPQTRPEIKIALEALKLRQPRLPLPPAGADASVNNGRMRAHYLPVEWVGNQGKPNPPGTRGNNGASSLDYQLTTSCFWIVSRGNNCHYCLGHQEMKLASIGIADDAIAQLDCNWSLFSPRLRAAAKYARQLTLEPTLVDDAAIAALQEQFTDEEIVELTYVIARFNATNRWTDSLGLPQDDHFQQGHAKLLTPTTKEFHNAKSLVSPETRTPRPGLAKLDTILNHIKATRSAGVRVSTPTAVDAQESLTGIIKARVPFRWEAALSLLPIVGPAHVELWNTILEDQHLSPRLKAKLCLVTALHNRAWYAAAHAIQRLQNLGVRREDVLALLKGESSSSSEDYQALQLAVKLTVDPHLITDLDIANVRKEFSDRETAMIIHVICLANLFDRFTAALGLLLEAEIFDPQFIR